MVKVEPRLISSQPPVPVSVTEKRIFSRGGQIFGGTIVKGRYYEVTETGKSTLIETGRLSRINSFDKKKVYEFDSGREIDDSEYEKGLSFKEIDPPSNNIIYDEEIRFIKNINDKQNKENIQKLVRGQMYQVDQPKTGRHFAASFQRGLISTGYPHLYFCDDERLHIDVYFGDVTVKAI